MLDLLQPAVSSPHIGFISPAGISVGRSFLSQTAINQRVSVKAVKTVVTMPIASVTANPLIGPVPSQNRIAAAMKVVTLASTTVASARAKPESSAWTSDRP